MVKKIILLLVLAIGFMKKNLDLQRVSIGRLMEQE